MRRNRRPFCRVLTHHVKIVLLTNNAVTDNSSCFWIFQVISRTFKESLIIFGIDHHKRHRRLLLALKFDIDCSLNKILLQNLDLILRYRILKDDNILGEISISSCIVFNSLLVHFQHWMVLFVQILKFRTGRVIRVES